MRKKHRRSLLISAVAYLYLFACGTSANVWATTSTSHFNDSLPGPTIVGTSITSGAAYYNGYDWQVTSLAPSLTPGDAISRAPFTAFQTYVSSTVANTIQPSTVTVLTGATSVGSSNIPASWFALGRSIRVTAKGRYNTTGTPNWTWGMLVGTTTIVTTAAQATPTTQSNQYFSAQALLTVSTSATVAHGWAMSCVYDIYAGSGTITAAPTANLISYSTMTFSPTNVDLTVANIVSPVFTWGTASASNAITFTEVIVELLN